ncbi:hypothetical protein BV22DRAFT_801709 [Leucogyrophana mollusca]|uniref:Uncharacterized protein n=1 Tax=Leucogyrophana mollusca TaxID=85980 RepID=A0ACB8B5H9_9AGAM|nr:hypothetical protein BV22DRAFT_801709 [Leucogyrophana mollusca]
MYVCVWLIVPSVASSLVQSRDRHPRFRTRRLTQPVCPRPEPSATACLTLSYPRVPSPSSARGVPGPAPVPVPVPLPASRLAPIPATTRFSPRFFGTTIGSWAILGKPSRPPPATRRSLTWTWTRYSACRPATALHYAYHPATALHYALRPIASPYRSLWTSTSSLPRPSTGTFAWNCAQPTSVTHPSPLSLLLSSLTCHLSLVLPLHPQLHSSFFVFYAPF